MGDIYVYMVMEQTSSWELKSKKPAFPKLDGSLEAEVVIIGGGLAGLLSAYLLLKERRKVVILEKRKIGEGVSYLTTAFITEIIDTDYSDLIKKLGLKDASRILDSHGDAIKLIERIVKEEGIECEFSRCSNFIYANNSDELETLKEELKALHKLKINAVLESGRSLGFSSSGFIEIKEQAKFHPMKFMMGLARLIEDLGGKIFEDSEVIKLEKNKAAATDKGRVSADWIIITTYRPFRTPVGLYFKKALYVSYVLELKFPKGNLREGIYEDAYNPYHYFRVDKADSGLRVILGGGDHRLDIPMDETKVFNDLYKYSARIFSGHKYTIIRKWRGPILESIDGLAYIGTYKFPNIIYAFAFSGNGMTYSAIAAIIARNKILNEKSSWEKVYKVGRLPSIRLLMVKGRDYSEELWNGVIKKLFKA